MKKYFKRVLIVVAILGVINVKALYYQQKPLPKKSIKDVIKESAQFYAGSSLALCSAGKTLQVLSGAPLFPGGIIDFDARYNDTSQKNIINEQLGEIVCQNGRVIF